MTSAGQWSARLPGVTSLA